MMEHIHDYYEQLSPSQKEIFAGYGLRQIKHFVEITLPKVEACLPEQAQVQGINASGKVQAQDDAETTYLWISDQQWQQTRIVDNNIDLKEDFIKIWQIFNLANYQLIELSHVHRDFLARSTACAS